MKASVGKLNLAHPFEKLFPEQLLRNSIEILNITLDHLNQLRTLPFRQRDPFDRLLAAQALVEGIPIIGVDPALDAYGIARVW